MTSPSSTGDERKVWRASWSRDQGSIEKRACRSDFGEALLVVRRDSAGKWDGVANVRRRGYTSSVAKRRAAKEGTIYKRADGSWSGQLPPSLGRRTVYGRTQREAREKLQALEGKARDGTLQKPHRMTVAEAAEQWFAESQRSWSPRTLETYRAELDNHLHNHRIAQRRLTDLDDVVIERHLSRFPSERAALKGYSRLSAIFAWARKRRLVSSNPMDLVARPKYERPEAKYFSSEEVASLVDTAEGWLRAFVVLGAACGLRQSELLHLRWDDVQADCIDVRGKGGKVAPVALGPQAQALLEALPRTSEYVFPSDAATPYLPSNFLRDKWRPLLQAAGVRALGLDAMRHATGSMSVSAGVQTKVLQKRLRHADVKTTLAIYEHSVSAQDVEAAAAIELQIPGLQYICSSKGGRRSRVVH